MALSRQIVIREPAAYFLFYAFLLVNDEVALCSGFCLRLLWSGFLAVCFFRRLYFLLLTSRAWILRAPFFACYSRAVMRTSRPENMLYFFLKPQRLKLT